MDREHTGLIEYPDFERCVMDKVAPSETSPWTLPDEFEQQRMYMETLDSIFEGSDSQASFVASMTKVLASRGFNRMPCS